MMRQIFFFMSYTFSPHVAAHEISNSPPFFTLRVESGLSSVYTRTEEKFEEGKRVAGPISPAVYGFLLPSPLIHHCPPQETHLYPLRFGYFSYVMFLLGNLF